MKKYSVQVRTNGKTEITEFDSIHSANRLFAGYIVDYGIDYVMLVENESALEIGKWVNVHSPVMVPADKTMFAVMRRNIDDRMVYVRRDDDDRKAAVFETREAAQRVADHIKGAKVVEV